MTDLFSDIFGGRAAVADASSSSVAEPPERSDEPRGVSEVVTPAGITVYYQAAPKRLYRVNGKEVPSVTSILGCLDKPALPWWGMKVGVEGVLELCRRGDLYVDEHGRLSHGGMAFSADDIVGRLNATKLTVNHIKNAAGDRGSSVHDAFELWAEQGVMPNPEVFPEHERGYVEALRKFLEESKIQPLAAEVMVGSKKHGYAGRYDLRALYGGHEIVTHLTPQKEKRAILCDPGLGLWDLKTSSGVYPTHFFQLEAYEEASIECGYQATDFRAVIHVCADGRYEVKLSPSKFSDFKAIIGAYKALERTKVPK